MVPVENGDLVTGSSDATVRVFTKEPERQANQELQALFEVSCGGFIYQSVRKILFTIPFIVKY